VSHPSAAFTGRVLGAPLHHPVGVGALNPWLRNGTLLALLLGKSARGRAPLLASPGLGAVWGHIRLWPQQGAFLAPLCIILFGLVF
jgi:hypothetical protein